MIFTSIKQSAPRGAQQRQAQLDFVKGIAIISVILNHAGIRRDQYYNFWNGQAVPLFIIVTCLLGCISLSKSDSIKSYFSKRNVKKTAGRIFLPFITAQLVLVAAYIVTNRFSMTSFVAAGGIGPGAYYPWLYVQFWILIPFMFLMMKKWGPVTGCVVLLSISIGVNILFSELSQSESLRESMVSLYRLSANRYLFLFALVCLLFEKRLSRTVLLIFSLFGALYIYAQQYGGANFEPFIFDSGTWKMYEIPSHAYSILAFLLLFKAHDYFPSSIQGFINEIGVRSWGIFNIQIVYFATVHRYLNINEYLSSVIALFVCIAPVFIFGMLGKSINAGKRSA